MSGFFNSIGKFGKQRQPLPMGGAEIAGVQRTDNPKQRRKRRVPSVILGEPLSTKLGGE